MFAPRHEPLGLQFILGTSTGTICFLIALALFISNRTTDKIPRKRGIPFVGSWTFFTARHKFVTDGLKKLGNTFTFNVLHQWLLQHQVIVVAGEEARQVFFGHRDMDPEEGYSVLHGVAPKLSDADIKTGVSKDGGATHLAKRLAQLFRRDRISAGLRMVAQLTIRAMSCNEITDDDDLVSKVTELYWNIEEGSTASSVLLPWFPSKARNLKKESTAQLYLLLKEVYEARFNGDKVHSDTLQVLIDEGDSINDAIQFMMGAMFAGIVNTGIVCAWTMLYLLNNAMWKAKATEEIRAFIAKYAKSGGSLGSELRCDIVINGHKIPLGVFTALPITSAHHDPNIYPDPSKWDPERYARNEDKKERWAYLGWGTGRHPCSGMRFAKLEVKTILAPFLTLYEAEVLDKAGSKVTELPSPDCNSRKSKTPPSQPVYIKYRRVSL
ncbi:cytochrome P450 [Rickenella mellea]|uniref:Cytochrome P450 n=1 Tax=Rickenella mellea TaxID=50990 RepID=A0A4Y7PY60_9AGAM|nr:cytochrome P450 [Rickenella mellea]